MLKTCDQIVQKIKPTPRMICKIRLHPELQDLSIKACMLKILRFLPI